MTSLPRANFARRFAPVERLEIVQLVGNRVRGYAAPVGGDRPCAVVIASGSRVFGVAVAGAFSTEAKAAGLRLGWCGFEVMGALFGMALGGSAELRCAVESRTLVQLNNVDCLAQVMAPRPQASVEAALSIVQRQNDATGPDAVMPFSEAYCRVHGNAAFVDATYRYLLGRNADPHGRDSFLKDMDGGLSPDAIWRRFMTVPEYTNLPRHSFPGPFDPGFPFGRYAFQTKGA